MGQNLGQQMNTPDLQQLNMARGMDPLQGAAGAGGKTQSALPAPMGPPGVDGSMGVTSNARLANTSGLPGNMAGAPDGGPAMLNTQQPQGGKNQTVANGPMGAAPSNAPNNDFKSKLAGFMQRFGTAMSKQQRR